MLLLLLDNKFILCVEMKVGGSTSKCTGRWIYVPSTYVRYQVPRTNLAFLRLPFFLGGGRAFQCLSDVPYDGAILFILCLVEASFLWLVGRTDRHEQF